MITGSTDLGNGVLLVTVDHDPTVTPTNVPAGTLLVDSSGHWSRKIDNGSTTNVNPFVGGSDTVGGGFDASSITTGTLSNSRLSASVTLQGNTFNGASQLVQMTAATKLPAVDASLLTALNATQLTSGTVPDARLSANVTVQGNTFNGASQLVQMTAATKLPAVDASLLTALNASNISSGSLADARLSANVPLLNASQTWTNNQTYNSSNPGNVPITCQASGTPKFEVNLTSVLGLDLTSDMHIYWSTSTSSLVTLDVGLQRNAAGELKVNNGGAGTGSLIVATLSATTILAANITGTTALKTGITSTTTGQVQFFNSTNANVLALQAGATGGAHTYTLPTALPSVSGQVLSATTGGVMSWVTASGSGTVTSVALSLPSIFTVSGSPVTTTGTLTGTLATQTANTVFAGPSSGGAATPTFRALTTTDIPTGIPGTIRQSVSFVQSSDVLTTSAVTLPSTGWVTLRSESITISSGSKIQVFISGCSNNGTNNATVYYRVSVDGVVRETWSVKSNGGTSTTTFSYVREVTGLAAGARVVLVEWGVSSGTGNIRPATTTTTEHFNLLINEIA